MNTAAPTGRATREKETEMTDTRLFVIEGVRPWSVSPHVSLPG